MEFIDDEEGGKNERSAASEDCQSLPGNIHLKFRVYFVLHYVEFINFKNLYNLSSFQPGEDSI